MALPGTEGLESKKGLAYAKLFAQQQVFAAKQAKLFEQVSSGDAKAIDAILNQKEEPSAHGETGVNGKAKRKRAPKDPDAPKRPKTGYQLFMIDKLSTVRAENEGLKMKELMPILATEWKELSEKDKKRYQKKALTEKGHYESALKTYKELGAGSAGGATAVASPAVSKGGPAGARAGPEGDDTDSSVDDTNKEAPAPRSVETGHGKGAHDDSDSDSPEEHKKHSKKHRKEERKHKKHKKHHRQEE